MDILIQQESELPSHPLVDAFCFPLSFTKCEHVLRALTIFQKHDFVVAMGKDAANSRIRLLVIT